MISASVNSKYLRWEKDVLGETYANEVSRFQLDVPHPFNQVDGPYLFISVSKRVQDTLLYSCWTFPRPKCEFKVVHRCELSSQYVRKCTPSLTESRCPWSKSLYGSSSVQSHSPSFLTCPQSQRKDLKITTMGSTIGILKPVLYIVETKKSFYFCCRKWVSETSNVLYRTFHGWFPGP